MMSNAGAVGIEEVVLAQPRGFCAGVDRAIEIVERALRKHGAPIYVRHEIVHNTYVVEDLKAKGVNAFFVADRNDLLNTMRPHFTPSTTLLLMGARDPSLGDFAKQVWGEL